MNRILLKNGLVYINQQMIKTDILIENERIKEIGSIHDEDVMVIDCTNQLITLGFIDMHVHLRSPGLAYKETVKTGTKSALFGGYSHVVAMANTKPVMDNIETINQLKELIKQEAYVNVYSYGAITKNLEGKELVDMDELCKQDIIIGLSDDGKGVQDERLMRKAFKKAYHDRILIVAHCEDEKELHPYGCVHDGEYAKKHHLVGINSASEYKQVHRDLALVKEIGNQYHICHISTRESVSYLKKAKEKGYRVSGEVTPHHLLLTEMDIKEPVSNYKMNPPLRSDIDQQALIKGLNKGIIEVIATDHAPHSVEEKNQSMVSAPFGIIGLQHAFGLLYTYLVKTNKVSLETILDALTTNPARILGIDHKIAVGYKANLAMIDLNKQYVIKEEEIVSKSKNTPFIGYTCFGEVQKMMINGKLFDISKLKERENNA